jgi:hypothetical protein
VHHHHHLAVARAFVEIVHRQARANLEALRVGGVTGKIAHAEYLERIAARCRAEPMLGCSPVRCGRAALRA